LFAIATMFLKITNYKSVKIEQTFERRETPKPLVDEWRLTGTTVLWVVLILLWHHSRTA